MRLAPDEDETRLADEARKLLTSIAPISRLHHGAAPTLDAPAWAALADLGWLALMLPSDEGGSAGSEVELALLFREVGRQCAPLELLTHSLAALLVADQRELREALLEGKRIASLYVPAHDGPRLLGAVGDLALEVDQGSARLFDLSGCSLEELPSLDPATRLHKLTGGTPIPLVRAPGAHLWFLGQLCVAAMLVGIAETALAQMVDYARIRQTFGKPIGSYQAVRHPCADAAMRLEAARCQLWFAATAAKEAHADAHNQLLAAKHLANESAAFATDLNIQVHGGIGVTDEHDAHVLLKHALLLRRLFGSKRPVLRDLLHAQFGG